MIEYKVRRQKFFDLMADNSAAIFPAAVEQFKHRDNEFKFYQDPNFYYLTGFNEPQACLVLIKNKNGRKSILFNRKKEPKSEIWNGFRLGQTDAIDRLDIESAFAIDDLESNLVELLNGLKTIYYPTFYDLPLIAVLNDVMQKLRSREKDGCRAPNHFINTIPILNEMRLIKSEKEIELISQASQISAAGHIKAMQTCCAGMLEFQLQSEIEHEFAIQGTCDIAYNTIVAGGKNASILHYTQNTQPLVDGQLVLIDAGAQYKGYAGDISRTFPINGIFSKYQAEIYQLVLDTQINAISQVKPNASLIDINNNVIKLLVDGLIELGILEGQRSQLIADGIYKNFYMHGIGHYLGLEVHDVGEYGSLENPRSLEPGMVITIEPGLYISEVNNVDDKWKNIAVRIEDNVLVTETGAEVLSADVPKSIAEIEALMAKG